MAKASGFAARQPPVFETADEERRHRLERLAGVCRVFGRLGFAEGVLGHVTVRNPGDPMAKSAGRFVHEGQGV